MRRQLPRNHRRAARAAISAIAAIAALAGTVLAAQTAQAGCGTRALGGASGANCSNSWGVDKRRDSGSSDYNLGTLRGSNRKDRETTDYNLGTAKRSPGWDRRRSLGRGTYKPR